LERPLPAYKGDEPYLFVCYSHDDQRNVYSEIRWLNDQGVNLWYDEGISPGSEWSDAIADAIAGCRMFVYFVSPQSVGSEHCRRELNFALSHRVKVQVVHLEATPVERGLELSLGNRQAILKHELSEARYREKLLEALAPDRSTAVRVETPPPTRSKNLAIWSVAALGLVIAGAWLYLRPAPETVATDLVQTDEVDVFLRPVRDLSDPPAPRFADALTDEILARLNTVPSWRTHLSSTNDEKGPGYVIEPSIRVGDESTRLSVNVVANQSSEVLESFSTDDARSSDNDSQQRLAMLSGHIAFQTIDMARMREESFRRTGSYEAVDLLVAARKQATRSLNDAEACTKAVELDPELAWAHTCLAQLLLLSDDAGERALGTELTAKARALAPDRGEVWASEAVLPLIWTRDYAQAERLLTRARTLNPFSIPTLHGLAVLYFMTGRLEESLEAYELVLPLTRASDPLIGQMATYQHMVVAFTAARYADLARELGFDNTLGPAARLVQAIAYAELEDPRAGPVIEQFNLRWADLPPRQRAAVAWAQLLIGRTEAAAARYGELVGLVDSGGAFVPGKPGTWLAWELTHYAIAAGRLDDAFRWLALGRSDEVDLSLLVASLAYTQDPRYAVLREDPRFADVFAETRAPRTD